LDCSVATGVSSSGGVAGADPGILQKGGARQGLWGPPKLSGKVKIVHGIVSVLW